MLTRQIMMGAALSLSLTAAASAQQAPRDSDILLSQDELMGLIQGQTLEFFDNSLASYMIDGSYEYRYAPGEDPFAGTYEVGADSAVCIAFDNGFNRCDLIVNAGERYVMIIANGDRYPVRSFQPIE